MIDAELQTFLVEFGIDLAGKVTVARRPDYTFLNFGHEAG
jgi:hypothetical protein